MTVCMTPSDDSDGGGLWVSSGYSPNRRNATSSVGRSRIHGHESPRSVRTPSGASSGRRDTSGISCNGFTIFAWTTRRKGMEELQGQFDLRLMEEIRESIDHVA